MSVDFSDPDARARAAAQAMWDKDLASRSLGMSLDAVGPGMARLSLTITAAMTNGHKTCHGGYIFTLADSAFAFACNSYNQNAVAQHCSVTFLRPAVEGDRLTAAAREVSRIGRDGIYDVKVTNQSGEPIAEFRGHSRTVKGTLIAEPT
jgi:acyl-CoA thioesterase